jgi:hypothetical protein
MPLFGTVIGQKLNAFQLKTLLFRVDIPLKYHFYKNIIEKLICSKTIEFFSLVSTASANYAISEIKLQFDFVAC